jgi:DNA-binding response OmpR family regulator
MKRLLVVEDEPTIAIALRDSLQVEGFHVDVVDDGCEAEKKALTGQYDLIVLDLMLPGQDGFCVCRDLRAAGANTPIIVLSVKDTEADKVRALELGADDYITKPFSLHELMARVHAVLRRSEPSVTGEIYEKGDLRLDFGRLEATRGARPIALTPTEFRILHTLVRRRGQVVPIDELLHEVWGKTFLTDRVIYTHINNIRRKLEPRPGKPQFIVGVRGVGYRIER